MTPEQEIWTEALTIERRHGTHAPGDVAARIAAFALAGDCGTARLLTIDHSRSSNLARFTIPSHRIGRSRVFF